MSQATKKRLVLVVCNKGGVGKSVVARALADLYRSSDKAAAIYDADGGVGSLLATLGTRGDNGALSKDQDPLVGIGYYDVRDDGGRPTLLDSLASATPIIMHDLAGGSLGEIKRIVDDGEGVDGFLDAVEAQGYRVTLLHVISNVSGATASVRDYLNAFGNRADHVAVVNRAWGKDDSDFPFWYGYQVGGAKKGGNTRADLLKDGGAEIVFPALQPGTFAKVEAANKAYSKAGESPDLTITERAHLSKFNKSTVAAFLEIKEKLGL